MSETCSDAVDGVNVTFVPEVVSGVLPGGTACFDAEFSLESASLIADLASSGCHVQAVKDGTAVGLCDPVIVDVPTLEPTSVC